ncbi:hypothetical protein FAIPA1_710006 [Frankia sp. AiPs1]|uniref:hypothetical protein n=1 Tax=Frankia sp. AiPa1 TaxID=573492 RepID=UPI00202AE188|nr:hypothetical protein [Frankia sp. AiPa1]MCL9759078.1 hypothetical protein [Frankia sp. AiPa1]
MPPTTARSQIASPALAAASQRTRLPGRYLRLRARPERSEGDIVAGQLTQTAIRAGRATTGQA